MSTNDFTLRFLSTTYSPNELSRFRQLVATHEDWLMEQILQYAKERNYTKYTSTLREDWRLSISGLSGPLMAVLETDCSTLELGPDDDFTQDPVAFFGIVDARKHRSRGISLGMFIGLTKYYRQSYLDLVHLGDFEPHFEAHCLRIVERFFDRVEIGYSAEWAESDQSKLLEELQVTNRAMTNEKNKYLTIFESSPLPIFVLDPQNCLTSLNHAAVVLLKRNTVPGTQYYNLEEGEHDTLKVPLVELFPWLADDLQAFVNSDALTYDVEQKMVKHQDTTQYFKVKFSRILDVSEKFSGVVVVFEDVTAQEQAAEELHLANQEVIKAQQHAIQELSTPIIPVMEGIIVMPLIGSIDSMRAQDTMRTLLKGISEHRARVVILDITGVPIVDTGVAAHLDKTIQAARLKGARVIVTGISDSVAESIVDLGIDWHSVETLRDLQTGLVVALKSLGIKLSQKDGQKL